MDLYTQSVSDMERLQKRLPEDAVVSLAKEVLRRLAQDLRNQDTLPEDAGDLAQDLIGPNTVAGADRVNRHLKAGVSAKKLYGPYLARASQRLGVLWEADEVTFAELTVGIGRIYGIMRTLRKSIEPAIRRRNRSAFFASVPGDNHTLGVKMAADLARREGWDVELKLDLDHDDLVDAVSGSGQLLVGLSGGGEHAVPNLARLVLALRVRAPEALILVSGNIVDVAAESLELMHVDAIASEYDEAMETMEDLWQSLQRRAT